MLQSEFSLIPKILDWSLIMFDNNNPYTLRIETAKGITKYYVSFTDGQSIDREVEVTQPVYSEFLRFVKTERNLKRWTERHQDYTAITDETLFKQVLHPPRSVEDVALDNLIYQRVWKVIDDLPEAQRRRFVLYYEFGFTFQEIAEIDGCKKQPVMRSVKRAEEKIKNSVNIFWFRGTF